MDRTATPPFSGTSQRRSDGGVPGRKNTCWCGWQPDYCKFQKVFLGIPMSDWRTREEFPEGRLLRAHIIVDTSSPISSGGGGILLVGPGARGIPPLRSCSTKFSHRTRGSMSAVDWRTGGTSIGSDFFGWFGPNPGCRRGGSASSSSSSDSSDWGLAQTIQMMRRTTASAIPKLRTGFMGAMPRGPGPGESEAPAPGGSTSRPSMRTRGGRRSRRSREEPRALRARLQRPGAEQMAVEEAVVGGRTRDWCPLAGARRPRAER